MSNFTIVGYNEHPETFFGTLDSNAKGNCTTPLDFFERSRPIYNDTPKKRMLELLESFGGSAGLENLPQDELANIFCERTADSIFAMQHNRSSLVPS